MVSRFENLALRFICFLLWFRIGVEGLLPLFHVLPGRYLKPLLMRWGAKIGDDTKILGALSFHNVKNDFSNLRIGKRCHIGREVFFDLAESIDIGDDVTISMRTTILTHTDPEHSAHEAGLKASRSPVVIEGECYLGASCIVLEASKIRKGAVIGAGALVKGEIPRGVVAVGVPARVIRS